MSSGNPVLPGCYADPEIHHFAGRFWIYPTFSAPYEEQTFFEAWSSADLTGWRNEGRILDFADVPWSTNRAAWAPSCAEKDGRYYFYFSAGDGAGLGVAVADAPDGPFHDALGHPLVKEYHHGAQPIDAHAFIDDDGTPYLYWGGWKHAVMARLGDDMTSIQGEIVEITPENYVEGPFMLKHAGRYYFMWSEGGWTDHTYLAAYGSADTPFGPFKREGVLLQNEPSVANGAGHHSVLRLPDSERYVIAYHRRPLEAESPHHRVVCLDELIFRDDGSIEPVKLTNLGVTLDTV
ncbi:glycoside hydrolase family 43 protein [Fimbriimonas ginsengisoli]|uniref:Glycoside hydrolase family 43 n=1 Tax=Fimbriimonas ginsengisoli Gsoil 348 TaxID=661478 RepID=A0A068NLS1_FIMGI|nr:glycoside hydrolase family 43 protein [Fimbriimonas ginsengisoli]AIE84498.1 glycoside hydrolase family 43 [Fimbriimonas ginsengisoli Gsoil 348]